MEGLAYVELTFSDSDKANFKNILKSLVKETDFYYSDTISRINGDVTDKLHLTLFYGLIDQLIDRKTVNKHISEFNIESVKLGNLYLKRGYKGMYQILMVEVLDTNNELEKLSKSLRVFDHHEDAIRDFLPHLTLAYVQNDFEINDSVKLPEELTVEEIRYCS